MRRLFWFLFQLLEKGTSSYYKPNTFSFATKRKSYQKDSLVCRHHHKLRSPVFHSQVGKNLRTRHICLYRLRHIVLHHRHMLVRSGMEHILRSVFLKYLFHTGLVGNISHDGMSFQIPPVVHQLQSHVMKQSLGLVHQNQHIRIERSHLPHYLATYRAGSTGYHHPLSFQVRRYRLHVNLYRFTLQQVFYLYLLYLTHRQVLAVPFAERRCSQQLYAVLHHAVGKVGLLQLIHLQRRHNHSLHSHAVQQIYQVIIVCHHR